MSVLDPSKDKLAYFKDNIQTAEDQEDFDASQYYYNRQEGFFKAMQPGLIGSDGTIPSGNGLSLSGQPNPFSNFSTPNSQASMNSFLAATASGLGMGSIGMVGMGMGSGIGMGMSTGTTSNIPPRTTTPTTSTNLPTHEMSYIARTMSTDTLTKPRPTFAEKGPDMSEFPALTSRSMSLDGETSSLSIRQNSEFTIQKEDFPALSAFGPSDRTASSSNEKLMSTSTDVMLQRNQQTTLNNSSIGSRNGGNHGTYTSSGNFPSSIHTFPTLNETKQNGIQERHQEEHSKFSLIGMLQLMRPNESERSLVHGYDLTSLGMNLNSSESLHQTFASPWANEPCTKEPQYNLPTCYYNQPPILKTTHLSKFQLETLFFVFYAMPKDIVQAYSAQELYLREWYYHIELKLWFKKQTNDGNELQYIYFDINTWERRIFGGNMNSINTGFMNEDDIRIKFNTNA